MTSLRNILIVILYVMIPVLLFVDLGLSSGTLSHVVTLNTCLIALLGVDDIKHRAAWPRILMTLALIGSSTWNALRAFSIFDDIVFITVTTQAVAAIAVLYVTAMRISGLIHSSQTARV